MSAFGVARKAELRSVMELQIAHYGHERAAALGRLEAWHAANPRAFLVLRDGRDVVGQVTMLPLKPAMLAALVDGSRQESHIEGADLFTPAERGNVRDIYIESMIVPPLRIFGAFIRAFARHLARIAMPRNVEAIYAQPVTPAGRLVIANLRFEPVGPALYAAKYASLAKTTASFRRLRRM